jgi:HD-GYP domain-containing protein (c-di-GMP phosphodiesterase class II)
VSVPNGIWDKPGPLNAAERERVRLGAYYTERILAQSRLLAPYARIAATAYERLDGSGYPKGLTAPMLEPSARLLAAADVYRALTEHRPHRGAFPATDAAEILAAEVTAGRLDGSAAEAVLAAAGQKTALPRVRPDGLTDREVEVLTLLAKGLTNKAIARRLSISPKTVQHHVAHVFEKTGVTSRAAAAVYAVAQGLDRH